MSAQPPRERRTKRGKSILANSHFFFSFYPFLYLCRAPALNSFSLSLSLSLSFSSPFALGERRSCRFARHLVDRIGNVAVVARASMCEVESRVERIPKLRFLVSTARVAGRWTSVDSRWWPLAFHRYPRGPSSVYIVESISLCAPRVNPNHSYEFNRIDAGFCF